MFQGYPAIDKWHEGVPRAARFPVVFGLSMLFVVGLGFGVWATMAPLASAVVASGSFVATGQNKQVQHLEGGIIHRVLVQEGDVVQANQPLVQLDSTAASAKLRRLTLRKYRFMATKARLEAQIRGSDRMDLVDFGADASDSIIKILISSQEAQLAAWNTHIKGQEEVLRKEIAGLQESVQGYKAQVDSNKARSALFQEELAAKRSLSDQQLIRKSEVLALQRSEAGLFGDLGELLGRIGDANERRARAEQQIIQLRSAAVQKSVEELHAAESEIDDLQEQIYAAQDVVSRTEVRAPVSGIVVKLNQHTAGGVIAPAGVILELLPVNDELIIEARVNPNEIAHLKEGQNALVRLTALNQRVVPMVEAKVIYVSADTVPDLNARRPAELEQSRRDSFILRVRLDDVDLARKVDGFRPIPGMPADIFVETGTRTFFTYLMRPLLDSFARAFRER
jgi:HlyD family type I secretion membrane fusion protein